MEHPLSLGSPGTAQRQHKSCHLVLLEVLVVLGSMLEELRVFYVLSVLEVLERLLKVQELEEPVQAGPAA